MNILQVLESLQAELKDAHECFDEQERAYGFRHLVRAQHLANALVNSMRSIPVPSWDQAPHAEWNNKS